MDSRDDRRDAHDGMVYCVHGLLVAALGYALGLLIEQEARRYVLGWMIHLRWAAILMALAGTVIFLFGFVLHLQLIAERVGRARARREAKRVLPDTSAHERSPPPGTP